MAADHTRPDPAGPTGRLGEACWGPSPYGCPVHGPEPRHHPVRCYRCRKADTGRLDARCERCAAKTAGVPA